MGAGLMSIPYAVFNCGLLLGSLLIIAGGLTFGAYYNVVVDALVESKSKTLPELVSKYYGN